MTGPIYDDFFHVLNACSVWKNDTTYRPLIFGMTCLAGESMLTTRLLALLFLCIAAFFFNRLFFRHTQSTLHSLALLVHPLVFFPVFYPSQLSTAVTMAWASASALFLVKRPTKWFIDFLACLIIVYLGNLIRIEALVFLFIVLGSYAMFDFSQRRDVWKQPFTYWTYAKLGVVVLLFLVYPKGNDMLGFRGVEVAATLAKFRPEAPFYPRGSFFATQIWAVFLYLKNYLLPFAPSFWGPWTNWWSIFNNSNLQLLLYASYFGVVSALLFFICSKRFGSLVRLTSAGALTFIAIASAFSSTMRIDWYFNSRAILAAALLSPFVLRFAELLAEKFPRYKRYITVAPLAYFSFALLFTYIAQYRSYDAFVSYELRQNGPASPRAHLTAAAHYGVRGDLQSALMEFHQTYSMLSGPILNASTQARDWWVLSLYKGWEISRTLGLKESAHSALLRMLTVPTYISALACIQDPEIDQRLCRRPELVEAFTASYGKVFTWENPNPALLRVRIEDYVAGAPLTH